MGAVSLAGVGSRKHVAWTRAQNFVKFCCTLVLQCTGLSSFDTCFSVREIFHQRTTGVCPP